MLKTDSNSMKCFSSIFLGIMFLSGMVSSCQQSPSSQKLVGTWQVDSVYSFYNGFSFWDRDDSGDWARYVYTDDGRMEEWKFDNPRYYRYELSNDTIYWQSDTEQGWGWFQIVALTDDQLVLRKEKPSMFGAKREERFEVRYFSRLE